MDKIIEETQNVVSEFLSYAKLKQGDICVIGCSTSEITGNNPGTNSTPQLAQEVFSIIYKALKDNGINIAAQCCEHLNRAIVVEKLLLINMVGNLLMLFRSQRQAVLLQLQRIRDWKVL